jgi:Uma2 family endonuclease
MSILLESVSASAANGRSTVVPAEILWRLSVDQYHEMIRVGILTENDPVELVEGLLVRKMPKKPPHSIATQLTRDALEHHLPTGWFLNDQEPITTEYSEPEPDGSVVRGERRQYLDRHPGAQELALVVEVADTTLAYDRTTKKQLYARVGIPIYWIVNLVERQLEVYTDPSGPADLPDYGTRQNYGAEDELPIVIEGREVGRLAVRDLLP